MASNIKPPSLWPAQSWLHEVDRQSLRADVWAALTAAMLVLPQSIAFAAIAGVPIQHGFYTAIITPIFAALFGSSKHMVSGPTTAISVLVLASVSTLYPPGTADYVQAVITLTLMAGLFQLALGLLRMGSLASFVSPSVMMGFITGAAVIIFVSQLPQVLGIDVEASDSAFSAMQQIGMQALHAELASTSIGFVTLGVAALVLALAPGWPNYLIALAVGTIMAYVLGSYADGIDYVPSVPLTLPPFAVPDLALDDIRALAPAAFSVALVGLLEATAISRGLALRSNQEIDVSQEFTGQGISNIAGSFFSAYVGSGSFTRSAANFDAGAKTPLAAIFASLFLLLILLLFGQWIAHIPVAAVAGIILLVAVRLIAFRQIKKVLTTSRGSSTVMIVTFVASLLVGLEFSIIIGVFVSLSFYLRRTSMAYLAMTAPDPTTSRRYFRNARAFELAECPQLACGRLDGQLYFGSVDDIRRQLRALERERPQQKNLLLLMKHMADVDMAGSQLLIDEAGRRKQRGGRLYLTMRRRQFSDKFLRFGVVGGIGRDNIFANKGEAIATIVSQLDADICAGCDKRIFNECPPPPSPESSTEGQSEDCK